MQTELELLAPARNLEIGIAAIDCGADSVYIGGPSFGARAQAGNSFEDIAALCRYGAPFGVGVYLTLNTILTSGELAKAEEYLWQAYEAGCKAVIVQDLRLLGLRRPPLALFASTQTDIRTPTRAAFLERLGLERLILPRELSLAQIREIREAVSCELESFVHGALCVCYSGRCYLSAYLTGRSANRGECAQPCRSNYTLVDEKGCVLVKDKPLLSLRDLNLSARLGELAAAGVTSFKIEGRLKNASYVRNIVGYYSGLLNEFIESSNASVGVGVVGGGWGGDLGGNGSVGVGGYRRKSLGVSRLRFAPNPNATFNRGYTEYNIDGHRPNRPSWSSGVAGRALGEEIGVVTSCRIVGGSRGNSSRGFRGDDSRGSGLVQFSYKTLPDFSGAPISNGDGLSFIRPDGSALGERANNCAVGGAGGSLGRGAQDFANGITGIVTLSHSLPSGYNGSASAFLPAGTRILRNYNIAFERALSAPNAAVRLIPVNLTLRLCDNSIIAHATLATSSENTDLQLFSHDDNLRICKDTVGGEYVNDYSSESTIIDNKKAARQEDNNGDKRTEFTYTFDIEGVPAQNPPLARATLVRQLEKSAAPFEFKVVDIQSDSSNDNDNDNGFDNSNSCGDGNGNNDGNGNGNAGVMYLYKTSALNEIRRRLSARLSAELSNRFSSTTTTSTTSNPNALHADHSTHVNHSVSDSCKGSSKEVAEESSQQATASCSDAYVNEMSINWPGGDVPLMQTKYCLRYELGLCPKSCSNNHLNNGYLSDNKAVAPTPTPTPTSLPASSRLYLLNGRNRLALAFDCQKCCMLVNPDPTVRKM